VSATGAPEGTITATPLKIDPSGDNTDVAIAPAPTDGGGIVPGGSADTSTLAGAITGGTDGEGDDAILKGPNSAAGGDADAGDASAGADASSGADAGEKKSSSAVVPVVVVLLVLLLVVVGVMYYRKLERAKLYPPHGHGTNNPMYDVSTGTSAGATGPVPAGTVQYNAGGAVYMALSDPACVSFFTPSFLFSFRSSSFAFFLSFFLWSCVSFDLVSILTFM
jgi:hypothetical protein